MTGHQQELFMSSSLQDEQVEAEEKRRRALTDEDVVAVVNEIETRFKRWLYMGLGRGVFALAWKGTVLVILLIAAYGASGGKNPFAGH
jgi:hypothetical protein